jgi:nitrile hydratase accessory protein
MALALHERGLFSWREWAEALGREVARGQQEPGSRPGFYEHWLAALEALVAEKGLASPRRLDDLRSAFDRAARATPHGAPILLANDPLRPAPPTPAS